MKTKIALLTVICLFGSYLTAQDETQEQNKKTATNNDMPKNEISFNVSDMFSLFWWRAKPYPYMLNYQRNFGKFGVRIGANYKYNDGETITNDTIPVTSSINQVNARLGVNYLILQDERFTVWAGADFIFAVSDSSSKNKNYLSNYSEYRYTHKITTVGGEAMLKINYRLSRLFALGLESNLVLQNTTGDQKSIYQYTDSWGGFQETTTRNHINQNAVMLYLPVYLHLNITF